MRKLISQYVIVVLVGVLLSGCQSNKLSPKNSADPVRPFLAEGQKAYEAKEWETAITAYRKVLEVDENSLPALYKLGNIAYRQKKLAKARGYYEKVVKVKPRYNKAQYNLAVVNLALAEKHFKFFTATAEVETDITPVANLLGHIYYFSRGSSKASGDTTALDELAKKLKYNSQY